MPRVPPPTRHQISRRRYRGDAISDPARTDKNGDDVMKRERDDGDGNDTRGEGRQARRRGGRTWGEGRRLMSETARKRRNDGSEEEKN